MTARTASFLLMSSFSPHPGHLLRLQATYTEDHTLDSGFPALPSEFRLKGTPASIQSEQGAISQPECSGKPNVFPYHLSTPLREEVKTQTEAEGLGPLESGSGALPRSGEPHPAPRGIHCAAPGGSIDHAYLTTIQLSFSWAPVIP